MPAPWPASIDAGNSVPAGEELDLVRDPAVHAKFAKYRKGPQEAENAEPGINRLRGVSGEITERQRPESQGLTPAWVRFVAFRGLGWIVHFVQDCADQRTRGGRWVRFGGGWIVHLVRDCATAASSGTLFPD